MGYFCKHSFYMDSIQKYNIYTKIISSLELVEFLLGIFHFYSDGYIDKREYYVNLKPIVGVKCYTYRNFTPAVLNNLRDAMVNGSWGCLS